MAKFLRALAHKVNRLEQPFHLTYLGAGAHYYFEHHVLALALPLAALFGIVALDLVVELFGKEG